MSRQRWRAGLTLNYNGGWYPSRSLVTNSPPAIIRHAVRFYFLFTLSYRDAEELVAERGLDVSHETVRRWVLKYLAHCSVELPPPSLPPHLAMGPLGAGQPGRYAEAAQGE